MNVVQFVESKKYDYLYDLCVISKSIIIDYIKVLNPFIDGKNGAIVLIDETGLNERLQYLSEVMIKSPLELQQFIKLSKEIDLVVNNYKSPLLDKRRHALNIESMLEVTINEAKQLLEMKYDPFEQVKERHANIYDSEDVIRYIKALTSKIKI